MSTREQVVEAMADSLTTWVGEGDISLATHMLDAVLSHPGLVELLVNEGVLLPTTSGVHYTDEYGNWIPEEPVYRVLGSPQQDEKETP